MNRIREEDEDEDEDEDDGSDTAERDKWGTGVESERGTSRDDRGACCRCCFSRWCRKGNSTTEDEQRKLSSEQLADKEDELDQIWDKLVHKLDRAMKRSGGGRKHQTGAAGVGGLLSSPRDSSHQPQHGAAMGRTSSAGAPPSPGGGRRRSGRSPVYQGQQGARRGSLSSLSSFDNQGGAPLSDHESQFSDQQLSEAGDTERPKGLPARVIAETIERLGTARAEDAFRICRYACIFCAVLHSLAPLLHYLIWVRTTPLLSDLCMKNYHFAKTGSGQTWGNSFSQERRFSQGCVEETQLHCDASCEPATALCVDGYEILVEKTPCLRCDFVLKTIILPSQARDKHIVAY